MAPTSKNSRKSLSTKCQLPGSTAIDKENAFLHSVSEFHSRIRRRESIRLKYKVSTPKCIKSKRNIIRMCMENSNNYEYCVFVIYFRLFEEFKHFFIF